MVPKTQRREPYLLAVLLIVFLAIPGLSAWASPRKVFLGVVVSITDGDTMLALTIVSIFAATSSQLLGAPVPGGPGFISIGNVSFQPHPPSVQYGYINGRLYNKNGSPANQFAVDNEIG